MGGFVKGDVVVVPFPFSDLSASKRRPALVLTKASAEDLMLAQITSRGASDNAAVSIGGGDFEHGGLNHDGNVRLNKLFTGDFPCWSGRGFKTDRCTFLCGWR
jgi:mRNA interferase MazF